MLTVGFEWRVITLNFEHRTFNYYDILIFFSLVYAYRLRWTIGWLTGYKAPTQHILLTRSLLFDNRLSLRRGRYLQIHYTDLQNYGIQNFFSFQWFFLFFNTFKDQSAVEALSSLMHIKVKVGLQKKEKERRFCMLRYDASMRKNKNDENRSRGFVDNINNTCEL